MSDLVRRLREYGSSTLVEMHEDREEAADTIEELERELAAIRAELNPQPSDDWPTGMAVRAMSIAYAAERALADRRGAMLMQIEAVVPFESFGLGNTFADKVEAEVAAYRKARGL